MKLNEDLSGMIFGFLKPIIRIEDKITKFKVLPQWKCECVLCGNTTNCTSLRLISHKTKSCGCLQNNRLYHIYHGMLQRAYSRTHENASYYENVSVCNTWTDKKDGFINFYNWSIQNGYNNKLTIDRIDNSKGYTPSNCRWATINQQQNNTRQNINIILFGEYTTVNEIHEKYGISKPTIYRRFQNGLRDYDLIKSIDQSKVRHRKAGD